MAHYKLDWHKYNVKRKLEGLPCVGEDAFEAMSGVYVCDFTAYTVICSECPSHAF